MKRIFPIKNLKDEYERIVLGIKAWFHWNGKNCNAIIGISGGKDSTIVAKLCVDALGKDRVIGVSMPDLGQSNNDAKEIADYLGIRLITIPIDSACTSINQELCKVFDPTDQTTQNIPARMRMLTLYAVAQSYRGRVMNTCNLSEDYIGYSTRWGDSVGDFCPISHLTVTELIHLGLYMKLPDKWVLKIPDDGLHNSMPDEEKLGFKYTDLDKYIFGKDNDLTPEQKRKIDNLHSKNLFKMRMPDNNDFCFIEKIKLLINSFLHN